MAERNVSINTGGSNTGPIELLETISATGATAYGRFREDVVIQVSGTATAFVAVVQRSTKNPDTETPNWAPAEDDAFDGDLTVGLAARTYRNPGGSWWRLNVTTLTGGTAEVSIMGLKAR